MRRALQLLSGFLLLAVAPVHGQISVTEQKGSLAFQDAERGALSEIRLYLRLADRTVSGQLQVDSEDKKTDSIGTYEQRRYRLATGAETNLKAVLELRNYHNPEVLVATLEYDGPPLAAKDSVELGMHFDDFARGMALHRLKIWWLAPTFVTDPRMLAGDNNLLLWQQLQGNKYHLLVPLAGNGMVGTLKVSDFENFRVSLSSQAPNFTPHRVPLFAYAAGTQPHALAPAAYSAAFAANSYYGKLRWEKPYPDVFDYLGWCSWNTYYENVSEEKVLNSVRSLQQQKVPLGFVLVDEGWRVARDQRLAGYGADPIKFPHGIAGLARTLHQEYHIPFVGVWHVFQGYWHGVDPESEIGKTHALFTGNDAQYFPDPRNGAGESFYSDWYKPLREGGVDFLKVDNQASTPLFSNGLLPIFDATSGEQHNLQEAARKYFLSDMGHGETRECVRVLNCMDMSLENAFNWRYSNIARNSEDYFPDSRGDVKDHVFWNAYNAYWTANFAFPDWDMFETRRDDGEFQATARAISGGPIYTTDSPGKENPARLVPLALSDGHLLRLDAPGMVTEDVLLADTGLQPIPLKVFGTITRPGLKAGMVAAFNVNKSAQSESGVLKIEDVPGLREKEATVAVYERSTGRVVLLDSAHPEIPVKLGEFASDLFTMVPVNQGAAVLGSLNKYLAPAAVKSVRDDGKVIVVQIVESGDFGAFLAKAPARIQVDGKSLDASGYSYSQQLLRIPQKSFGDGTGTHEIRIARTE